MKLIEKWKDIPNYIGFYQVSNLGRVRSLDRIIIRSNGTKQQYKSQIIKPLEDDHGYYFVNLWKNNKCTREKLRD